MGEYKVCNVPICLAGFGLVVLGFTLNNTLDTQHSTAKFGRGPRFKSQMSPKICHSPAKGPWQIMEKTLIEPEFNKLLTKSNRKLYYSIRCANVFYQLIK